jgi:hypothetical protein
MCKVTPEFIAEVVKSIPTKDIWDYLLVFIPAFTPAIALVLGFVYFKKQHIQSRDIKLIEKDVDRLYNSADLFFDYADSIGLFYSMTRIKLEHLLTGDAVPESVESKTRAAANDVYAKFSAIHKSVFLLRSIGENDVATLVENYRIATIEFRKDINIIAKWNNVKEKLPENFSSKMVNKIERMQDHFGKEKVRCLDEIARCKRNLSIK